MNYCQDWTKHFLYIYSELGLNRELVWNTVEICKKKKGVFLTWFTWWGATLFWRHAEGGMPWESAEASCPVPLTLDACNRRVRLRDQQINMPIMWRHINPFAWDVMEQENKASCRQERALQTEIMCSFLNHENIKCQNHKTFKNRTEYQTSWHIHKTKITKCREALGA